MTARVTSPIAVECTYGDGSRPLDAVVDSLIFTEADAINRGYAELNRSWKIIDSYDVTMWYPNNGYLIDVGKFLKFTIPEIGLVNEILYIQRVNPYKQGSGVALRLTLERYETFELNPRPSGIDTIDDGTPSDDYDSTVDGGTPTVPYTDIIDGGTP